jgi:hypothetical protein
MANEEESISKPFRNFPLSSNRNLSKTKDFQANEISWITVVFLIPKKRQFLPISYWNQIFIPELVFASRLIKDCNELKSFKNVFNLFFILDFVLNTLRY